VATDQFTERLAKIRTRFAANLPGKLEAFERAVPQLTGEGEAVMTTLATAHRSVHELCGIGPTVGFPETGRAARIVERTLLQPLRAKRGLNEPEIASIRQGLAALRTAFQTDLQREMHSL
jgi:Hpt domain